MTDQELQEKANKAYGDWLYHQAAERGYDHQAATEAFNRYLKYTEELKQRQNG